MEPHYLFHSHLRSMSIMWRRLEWRSSFGANRPMVELRSSGDTMVEHLASRRRQLPAAPWWSCGVLELLPPPPLPAAPSFSILAPPPPLTFSGELLAKAVAKARPKHRTSRGNFGGIWPSRSNSDVPARSSAGVPRSSAGSGVPARSRSPSRSRSRSPPQGSGVPRSSAGSGVPGRRRSPSRSRPRWARSRSPSRSRSRSPPGSGVPARSGSPSGSRSRSPPQNWDERAWQCPQCESMNHRSFMFCHSWDCGESRPLMQQKLPGDWFCFVCGNHNYERRRSCNNTHCETMQHKPGDWHCPACGNHNFAVRTVCNKKTCRARRPRSS